MIKEDDTAATSRGKKRTKRKRGRNVDKLRRNGEEGGEVDGDAEEIGWRRAGIGAVEMKAAWLEKCEPPSPRIHFHTSSPSKLRVGCESERPTGRAATPRRLETDDRARREVEKTTLDKGEPTE